MGIKALRKIQIGEETGGKGTAVPTTAALAGVLTLKSSPTIHRPVEERGNFAEFSRSVRVANLAELTFEGDATFEQILYWLHMGILGAGSPVSGNANKIWTFTPAMTAAGTFDSFTIEYGDDIEQWETEYCLARKIEISGAMNEAVKVRVDIFGRKMTVCDFTGELVPPTLESAITQKARVYIDNDGVIGTTEKSDMLISFTYTITTGLEPKRYGDGSLDFSGYTEKVKGVELKATFAFNANAEAERLLFNGETLRLVRIEIEGSTIAADAASGSALTAILTAGATTAAVTSGADFVVGETIEIEDEHLRVTAINANNLTVIRGVYGTTAVEHASTTTIDIVNERRLTLDMSGIYTDFATLSERDGEDVVEVTLSPQRGLVTYKTLFEVAVANDVASLP